MEKLSAALIVKNQEEHIEECLSSLKWADEIVILDGMSTDRTVEICRRFTGRVFQREFTSFNEERQAVLEKTANRWVFMVDGDMVVPEPLAREIRRVLEAPQCAAYAMRALTFLFGRPIRRCGWFEPDFLRLFDKEKGGYDTRLKYIDHFIVREGETGVLENHLIHYGYKDLAEYLNKINRYTTLDAQDLHLKGRTMPPGKAIVKPVFIFLYKYFYRRGFLDGVPGLIISLLSSFTYLISYFKLWELRRK
ncbi:MAG: glycosyltransferase family 2 protein [Endomicrobiales bacterium]